MAAICLVVAHARRSASRTCDRWAAGRPRRVAAGQDDRAVDSAPPAAHLHDRGWLAGVDVIARGFALHTATACCRCRPAPR
jgi:hypothetical protein